MITRERILAEAQKQEAIRRYLAGEGCPEIARDYGVTAGAIRRNLQRRGVTRRSTTEANRIAGARRRIKDGLKATKRRYKKLGAAGLCPVCGRSRPRKGKVQCAACIRKRIRESAQRVAQGLCRCCKQRTDGQRTHCEKCRAVKRAHYQRLKAEVFAAYGGRCACCGETELVFLCIDHVNNNGAEHRRSGDWAGPKLYRWLKRQGYPPEFQVLCHNCNFAKQFGECPHQRARNGQSI